MMLDSVRKFFQQHIGAITEPRDPEQQARVAAAALWLEMTRVDGRSDPGERQVVLRAVREKFGLGDEEAQALVAVADQAAAGATDDYQFTSLINQHLSAAQKERIVEYLWEVAYADGSAAPYEEHFVRKIAELLYVSHGAFLMAKERARTRAG
jgi:uncharacterized tellurite resistance protein B-like protein